MPDEQQMAMLSHRFASYPSDTEIVGTRPASVRAACFQAANEIVALTGGLSHEQSLAITHLETAMFWAIAAISRGEGS